MKQWWYRAWLIIAVIIIGVINQQSVNSSDVCVYVVYGVLSWILYLRYLMTLNNNDRLMFMAGWGILMIIVCCMTAISKTA